LEKVNTADLEELTWASPKGTFQASGVQISEALGREAKSTDLMKRHPFDVEIGRIPPGKLPFPYHSHSAQWEFYHIISGTGKVRDESGMTPVGPGDAFLFKPGEAHVLINDGAEDLVYYCVADNPIGESCHYPDSGKHVVYSPERKMLRSEHLDYFDGEE
jgi:uncharacterized cupin superfamily protein